MCDVPEDYLDLVVASWEDFKRNPGDYEKFRAFDWVINVGISKWRTYADIRKASST